jgi:anthranilate phosphoribosyltransferase
MATALSSKSGAADVLQALGIKIDLDAAHLGTCIRDAGIGHVRAGPSSGVKNVGPTRSNSLCPFPTCSGRCRTRQASRQMIGTFSKQWVEPM